MGGSVSPGWQSERGGDPCKKGSLLLGVWSMRPRFQNQLEKGRAAQPPSHLQGPAEEDRDDRGPQPSPGGLPALTLIHLHFGFAQAQGHQELSTEPCGLARLPPKPSEPQIANPQLPESRILCIIIEARKLFPYFQVLLKQTMVCFVMVSATLPSSPSLERAGVGAGSLRIQSCRHVGAINIPLPSRRPGLVALHVWQP